MSFWNPLVTGCISLDQMLTSQIGVGTCAAWAQLFHESLDSLGITGSSIQEVRPNAEAFPGAVSLLIANWQFGSHTTSGADGICQTARQGDDQEAIRQGRGVPFYPCVDIVGEADTVPLGDDELDDFDDVVITSGPDGICDTAPRGDDVLLEDVGEGGPNGICMTPGADGLLNILQIGGDDEIAFGVNASDTPPFSFTMFTYQGSGDRFGDVANRQGIPGQGNDEPPAFLSNHFVVEIDGMIYDPSYGLGPFPDQAAHEAALVAGLGGILEGEIRVKENSPDEREASYQPRPDLEQ